MGLLDAGITNHNVLVTSVDNVLNWARLSSLWPMGFGLACCAIEMMATNASNYDLERFGIFPRSSPRQSDLMIVAGTVTMKMAERVIRLYERCPNPVMFSRWEAAPTAEVPTGSMAIMSLRVLTVLFLLMSTSRVVRQDPNR